MTVDTHTTVRSADHVSLKSRTVSASIWVLISTIAGSVIRLASNLVLTRLLFPEAFGLMLMASTATFIVGMLSDVGVQQSIIRGDHGEDPLYLDTAWSFQIVRGVAIWLVACLLAYLLHIAATLGWLPLGSTYADARLPWVIVASSFGAVVQGFQATDLASATRKFIVKPVVIMEIATQLFGVFVMGALAWWMRSVWALVIAGLITTLTYVIFSHVVVRLHRNRLRADSHFLAELFAFGKWIALSSSVSVFVSSGPSLILGALIGPLPLGVFSVAFTLAGALDLALQNLFGRVILPAMSEVVRNEPDRITQTFHRLRWRTDPAMLVAGGALFALGPTVIELLYDARYHAAGQMLQVLSLALIFGRFAIMQQVYMALNEPRYLVVLNVARAVSLYVSVPVAFHLYGLNGALVAIALREVITIPFIFWFNARHGLNSFKLELLWLLFWPLGWCLGAALLSVHAWALGIH